MILKSLTYWLTFTSLMLVIICSGFYEYHLWRKGKEIRAIKNKSSKRSKAIINDLENDIDGIKLRKIIGVVIIALCTLFIFLIQKKENVSDLIETKDNKDQKRFEAIISKLEATNNSDTLISSIKEGGAFYLVIKLNDNPDYQRKYIVDMSYQSIPNRTSLYLDVDNNLVYRIVDIQGETYTLKIAQKVHNLSKGKLRFLYCDYGSSKDYSFMRMIIDDTEVGRLNLSSYIDFPRSKIIKKTIGSDISGSFGSSLYNFEMVFFEKPLLKNNLDTIRMNVLNYYGN